MSKQSVQNNQVKIHTLTLGWLQANCFIIQGSENRALIIDPGGEAERVEAFLDRHALTPLSILLTHAHFDHLQAVPDLVKNRNGLSVVLHPDDQQLYEAPDEMIQAFMPFLPASGEQPPTIPKPSGLPEDLHCEMLHTPGHSPGSVSYYFPQHGMVFVGDTLFQDSIGRHDFPGGSLEKLLYSVRKKLFTLPDDVKVFCGHGPSTTIGRERRNNPFFQDE